MNNTVAIITISVTALGLVSGAIGHALSPGPAQRVFLFLASLAPANVVGAYKALVGKSTVAS
jgi:hypothetical protein